MIKDSPELLLLLVNDEQNAKAMKKFKECGLTSATFFFAHSMTDKKLWQILGLDDMHRECTLIIGPSSKTKKALHKVADVLQLDKKNNGVGFRIALDHVLGVRKETDAEVINLPSPTEKGNQRMHDIVVTIVDRGKADIVLNAANHEGANGGTIIRGRGSAAKSKKVFNMEIEPEKEIVVIIIDNNLTKKIVEVIANELKIEEENAGILFTFPLEDVRGIL